MAAATVFRKEILRASTPSGRALSLVRKRAAEGACRGVVVLVHGFAQNRYSWHLTGRSMVNELALAGFDVFNLELPGHGRSRRYGTRPPGSFDAYVLAVREAVPLVLEHASAERAFLIGHSLGGAVCYAAASHLEPLLAGVVTLGGIHGFGDNPTTRRLGRLLATLRPFEATVRNSEAAVFVRGFGKFLAKHVDMVDRVFDWFPMAGWVSGSLERELLEERLSRGMDWTSLGVLLTMMSWAVGAPFSGPDAEDYAASFANVRVPLLVVAGDHDLLARPRDARSAYDQSRSEDKTWRLLGPPSETVHWGHLDIILGREAPRVVWPLVRDWLVARAVPLGDAVSA